MLKMIYTDSHSQLIFGKVSKAITIGKWYSFQQVMQEQLDIHIKLMNLDTVLTPITNINSKWIRYKCENTIKLLEDNMEKI